MTTVVCVLNTGCPGQGNCADERFSYDESHVIRLHRQLWRWSDVDFELVCLTDQQRRIEGVRSVELVRGLPGWWSKLELFDHDLGRVVYMDLDCAIRDRRVSDLLGFSPGEKVWMLADMAHAGRLASGVMVWDGSRPTVAGEFVRRKEWMGDQDYLGEALTGQTAALQDALPGLFGSSRDWTRAMMKDTAVNHPAPSVLLHHGMGKAAFFREHP